MRNVKDRNRHPAAALLGGLLLFLLLTGAGCGARKPAPPSPDAAEEVSPAPEPGPDAAEEVSPAPKPVPDAAEEVPSAAAEPEPVTVPDPAEYEGLVLSRVYGNGGSAAAPAEHGFIELTNAGSRPLALEGLALYYRSGDGGDYVSFPLPAETLDGGGRFLVRCASSAERGAGYDASCAVFRIEDRDADWDVLLSGRDIRLALAPTGLTALDGLPPEEIPGVISYYAAADRYRLDTGYVTGASPFTAAVRVIPDRDSGYCLRDLTKATTEQLEAIAPVTREGKRAEIRGSKLSEVRFSRPAGIYADPFELELEAPDGYSAVYYTTDGSDPASSDTRKRYEGPIPLSDTGETEFGATYRTGLRYVERIASSAGRMPGAHVIKARALDGERWTGVYTGTYFVSREAVQYRIPILSVSLETHEMFGNPGFYHNFNPSSNEPNTRGRAFLEVFDREGIRRGYSNVELSAAGHGSSSGGMRSMKVFFKASENGADGTDPALYCDLFGGYARNAKGQRITAFSRLVLRNSGNDCGASWIRDAYMQRVSAPLWADTMACAPVLVFVNGDFWGVYNARERYSGDYVQSHYGVLRENVALIESDYSKVHTNQNAPFIVTSGLEDDADDFNELTRFVRRSDMADGENYRIVEERLDLDSLIDLFAARLYFSAIDFPGNNVKLWRNRSPDDPSGADCRWHFVLLDMDMGMSFYKNENSTTETSDYFGWLGSDSTVASMLIHRLLENEGFRNRFLARFRQLLEEVYVPGEMEAALDAMVLERAPVAVLQKQRWGASMDAYTRAISDMRQFVRQRNRFALRFLCARFGVTEEELARLTPPD